MPLTSQFCVFVFPLFFFRIPFFVFLFSVFQVWDPRQVFFSLSILFFFFEIFKEAWFPSSILREEKSRRRRKRMGRRKQAKGRKNSLERSRKEVEESRRGWGGGWEGGGGGWKDRAESTWGPEDQRTGGWKNWRVWKKIKGETCEEPIVIGDSSRESVMLSSSYVNGPTVRRSDCPSFYKHNEKRSQSIFKVCCKSLSGRGWRDTNTMNLPLWKLKAFHNWIFCVLKN